MGEYKTAGKTVQFSDGDTLRDVADLYAVVDGEFEGTPSTESEALKAMLGGLQAGVPLSADQWDLLARVRSKYADKLAAFRAGPDNETQGWVPQPKGGGRIKEALRTVSAVDLLIPSRRVLREADAPNTGAMVALYPSPDVAKAIAIRDGENPGDLHVTLALLGKAAGLDTQAAKNAVGRWASQTPPMTGKIVGTGQFTDGPAPVCYATPDLPALPAARQALVTALGRQGVMIAADHGFVPHITLASKSKRPQVDNLPLAFDHAALVLGDERWDFPLSGRTDGMRLSRSELWAYALNGGGA